MSSDAPTIADRAEAVQKAGVSLRRASVEHRAAWLAASAGLLLREVRTHARALSESTGLSIPMIEWAAQTTLDTVDARSLSSLAAQAGQSGGEPISMLAIILAGNVFTAPVRGIVVPLLLGVPVLVKSSSRETLFPAMLKDALRRADDRLAAAMDVIAFPGGDVDPESSLLAAADAVSVYGSDETVAAIRTRHGEKAVIAHGHGVSAAFCGPAALGEDALQSTLSAVALDVCAYDQRGCLSPQVVYVEPTPRCSTLAFAQRLADEGLAPLSKRLPRGPLPLAAGAAQTQWRGAGEVEGRLIRGEDHAICVRPPGSVRWSPGYRNLTVMCVGSLEEAIGLMRPFASSLKCLGADDASRRVAEARLQEAGFEAYACPLGHMQTPTLDAPADGRPIWQGLLRP